MAAGTLTAAGTMVEMAAGVVKVVAAMVEEMVAAMVEEMVAGVVEEMANRTMEETATGIVKIPVDVTPGMVEMVVGTIVGLVKETSSFPEIGDG